MEKEDTSLSPDNRMTENSKATRICILNHFFSVLSVELIQLGQPYTVKLVFTCSEMMRYINICIFTVAFLARVFSPRL